MAAVGLRFFVAAQIDTETRGAPITYKKGMRLGPARAANVTFERNSDPLYGDDVIQDNDNGITGGTIDTESTQMTSAERVYILGEEAVTGANNEFDGSDAASPYVGNGYFRVLREKDLSTGVVSTIYEAWWFHKVQFSENNINAATREGRIAWQTPQINGRMMGVYIDASGKARFFRRATFNAEGGAIAWLLGKANMAAAYDATKTYALGDYCIKEGVPYICISAIATAEAWTAAHWAAVTTM